MAAFVIAAAVYAALAGIDTAQSLRCLRVGTCIERNPVLARLSPGGVITVKVGTTTAVIAGAWALRRRHPRVAWVLVGAAVGVQAAVVTRNARGRAGR